ncbi:MAG: extracellular solute-binding protein [Pirellulales bacterium]|nr:extracellular solute-binding protein [Pirellulales bacterium]
MFSRIALSVVGLAVLAGCPSSDPTGKEVSKSPPLAGITLRLAVVDDPALAAAVEKVCGEWKTQTGAELSVEPLALADLAKMDALEADAVVCPSHLLAPLAERGLLAPVPTALVESPSGGWMDFFELARSHEAAWAGRPMAFPLGSPVLVCYYRADLFDKHGLRPPTTWKEYHEAAKLLAARERTGQTPDGDAPWSGTLEPLAPGWAGLTLLARAAAAAKHPDNYSTLFRIQTMEPLIDSPPMIRALMYLVADAKFGPADATTLSPDAVRERFWRGQAAMALTWPTGAASLPEDVPSDLPVAVTELPGSADVFNIDEGKWDSRRDGPNRVPLLGVSGRLGVLSRDSEHVDAAADLLMWLSGTDLSAAPSAQSPATTLFRRSQVRQARMWTEAPMAPAASAAYAELTESTFQREQWLFALRIPGRGEYLAALDEAVGRAIEGKATPTEALRDAAGHWRDITRRLGLEKQHAAYLRSLGLEP